MDQPFSVTEGEERAEFGYVSEMKECGFTEMVDILYDSNDRRGSNLIPRILTEFERLMVWPGKEIHVQ